MHAPHKPKYARLIDDLREKIVSGTLKAGEKIPTEREICKNNKVSRITVRAALNELEREGLVARRQGLGTFVGQPMSKKADANFITFAYKSVTGDEVRNAFIESLSRQLNTQIQQMGLACLGIQIPYFSSLPDHIQRSGMDVSSLSSGLVLASYDMKDSDIQFLEANNIPAVVIGKSPDPRIVPSVVNDHEQEARLGVEHMFKHGCRRLALIDGPFDSEPSSIRLDTYKRALPEFGLEYDPSIVVETAGWSRAKGRHAASELLSRNAPFDAILSYGDLSTLGVVDGMREAGVHIPSSMPLFMLDYFPMVEEYMPFPVSGAGIDSGRLAATALESLQTLKSGGMNLSSQIKVPMRIHIGTSCGCKI